jgi:hypothetical protein
MTGANTLGSVATIGLAGTGSLSRLRRLDQRKGVGFAIGIAIRKGAA